MLGDAAASREAFGSIGAVQEENLWPQVGPFGRLLTFFAHIAHT